MNFIYYYTYLIIVVLYFSIGNKIRLQNKTIVEIKTTVTIIVEVTPMNPYFTTKKIKNCHEALWDTTFVASHNIKLVTC